MSVMYMNINTQVCLFCVIISYILFLNVHNKIFVYICETIIFVYNIIIHKLLYIITIVIII
jgi:hypothetical protein